MGVGASTTKSSVESNIVNTAYSSCNPVAASSVLTLKDVVHDPLPSCETSEFIVDQNAAVQASCVITNMQDSMAELMTTATAEAQAGLGIAVSTNETEVKSSIEQKIVNECSDINVDTYLSVEKLHTRACNAYFIQSTDAQTACQLNASQTLAGEVAELTESGATGFDPTAIIFGFVIIAIVAGVIYLVYKGFAKPAANPPEIGVSVPPIGSAPVAVATVPVANMSGPAIPTITSNNIAAATAAAAATGLPQSITSLGSIPTSYEEAANFFTGGFSAGGFGSDLKKLFTSSNPTEFVNNATQSNSMIVLLVLILMAIVVYYAVKKHHKTEQQYEQYNGQMGPISVNPYLYNQYPGDQYPLSQYPNHLIAGNEYASNEYASNQYTPNTQYVIYR
jgi:hypothetical protein